MVKSIEEQMNSCLSKAERLYEQKAFDSKIQDVYRDAYNVLYQSCYDKDTGLDNKRLVKLVSTDSTMKKILSLAQKRSKEQGRMTVGELIEKLSKFNPNSPVKVSYYVSQITDSGTDMGGSEEHSINDINDLETRVVLSIDGYD